MKRVLCKHLNKVFGGNLMGRKFNSLFVLDYNDVSFYKEKKAYIINDYLCVCDCGKRIIVKPNDLVSGKVKDCGCGKGEST